MRARTRASEPRLPALTSLHRLLDGASSRARGAALAYIFAIFPLTPAFVTFASLHPPGVSLLPGPAALAVFAGAAIAAIVLAWPRANAGDVALRGLRGPLSLFVGSSAISALCGVDPATSLLVLVALAISAIVHLAVIRDGDAPGVRRGLYFSFLIATAAAAATGFLAWASGEPPALTRIVNDRAVGTFVVPGEFAGYLVLAIAVAVGVAATSTGRLRLCAWSALVFAVPALAATFSRAGWYGCSVAMALLVVVERPRKWVVAAVLAALAIEARWLLGFSDHHNPSEEFARLPIWTAAVRAARLYPLTGTGAGGFRLLYGDLRPPSELAVAFHPHSAILGTLTETGVLGVVAVAVLVVAFARLLLRRLRAAHPSRRPLALAIAAGLAGTAVQASVDEIQVLVLGCWLPFMALALVEASPDALRSHDRVR